MLGVVLVLQIITGITLAFHFTANITTAFNSIVHIHREIWYGGIIRFMHSNGAGIFLILVYLHIGKAIYYGSYCCPRIGLWYAGIIIYFLMMATAFLGYTLPFGSMSYWGGTVITSMFSAIPFVLSIPQID
jgi:ubiquinol-cytochrome c reductase cytochrome b subunit